MGTFPWEVLANMGSFIDGRLEMLFKIKAIGDVIGLEKDMFLFLEGDDVTEFNLCPRSQRVVVKLES
jgi:hypothetical protein